MAKRTGSVKAAQESPVERPDPRKKTGPCPRNANHTATRVYKSGEAIRYCVCDDCGTTWKVSRRNDEEIETDAEQSPED
jgi:hypothetical protein